MGCKRRGFALSFAAAGAVLAVGVEAHAIVGRPLTPMSYAGVARRTVRRTTYAAAAAAPVAAAAAVPVLPAGCSPYAPCGGVVYRPAYSGATVVYVPR